MFTPDYTKDVKLPRFQSPDKGLEDALNLLARAIEQRTVPDIRLSGGTMEWTDRSLLLRPDSSSGGGGGASYVPWQPTFLQVEATDKVKFNLGSLNGIIATNWDTPLTLSPSDTKFVVLNVSAVADTGAITGFTIGLDASFPAPDNPTENVLPSTFKVLLGVVKNRTAQMFITYNLVATGLVVFTKSIASPAMGAEPFTRFWRWQVTRDSAEA